MPTFRNKTPLHLAHSYITNRIHRNQFLLIHAIHHPSSLFKLIGNILQQVHAAKLILRIPSVELDHVLDFVISRRVNLQRLSADVPINALSARRSGQ